MTDRYAVIGNPVAHSKSPLIHAEFARQTGDDMEYVSLYSPLERFAETVRRFRSEGGRGANVTLPFKEEAFRLATSCTDRARLAEAVNTMRFEGEQLLGDNTDGAGLLADITSNLGVFLPGKRVLLLGAGGAARGVIAPLLAASPRSLSIANRGLDKALALARKFSNGVEALPYPELAGRSFDIVINATSASLSGSLPPVPEGVFRRSELAYDMMYGKGDTPFLRRARIEGAGITADGLGMLVEQAAESYHFWRGIRPRTQEVLAMLRRA